MGFDHRVVDLAARKDFGKRMAHEFTRAQCALGRPLCGLTGMTTRHCVPHLTRRRRHGAREDRQQLLIPRPTIGAALA
jgi:hypothetical protein